MGKIALLPTAESQRGGSVAKQEDQNTAPAPGGEPQWLDASQMRAPKGNWKGSVITMRWPAMADLPAEVMEVLMDLSERLGQGRREPWGLLVRPDPANAGQLLMQPVASKDTRAFEVKLDLDGRRGRVDLHGVYHSLHLPMFKGHTWDVPVWTDQASAQYADCLVFQWDEKQVGQIRTRGPRRTASAQAHLVQAETQLKQAQLREQARAAEEAAAALDPHHSKAQHGGGPPGPAGPPSQG